MIKEEYINKIGLFEHYDKNKKYGMNVFYFIPSGDIQKMKIVIVMCGCGRDYLNHLKKWTADAEKNGIIVISPEFDRPHYSIADHEYGNVIDIEYDFSSQDIYTPYMRYGDKIKERAEWTFDNIDEVYLEFIKKFDLDNNGYALFGHSSGAQFAHRFLMLGDSKYCKRYVCASAGVYTFFDEGKNYPYGIKNLTEYEEVLKKSLSKDAYFMVGEKDVETAYLNSLPDDVAEGGNRVERAKNFYSSAEEYARKKKTDFNWKFMIMPDTTHYDGQIIPFAANLV